MTWLGKGSFRFFREQQGFALVETLVGLAIFAAVSVALLNGLSTGNKSLSVSQDNTFNDSLAKSQAEYIKDQVYISVVDYGNPDVYQVVAIPADLAAAGYTVEIIPPETVEAAGISGFELQGITIKVKRHGSVKSTLTLYRTGLAL